jgi:hypothetical protein
MHRKARFIVTALAVGAAALAPAAYAGAVNAPEEPGATAADWARELPAPAGIAPTVDPPDPATIETYPAEWPDIDFHAGVVAPTTVEAPSTRVVAGKKTPVRRPSTAKQRGFWGIRNKTAVQLITDNSPSQNRLTKAAPTRTLASTLTTYPS